MCAGINGSHPAPGGQTDDRRIFSWQFATKEAAVKAATLLSGVVAEQSWNNSVFAQHQPIYEIVVGKAHLNAGLVINTFMRNPRPVALRMLQTEIDRENGVATL